MKRAALVVAGVLAAGSPLSACVADDPVVASPVPDGGTTTPPTPTTPDSGGPGPTPPDGGPTTCAGQPFGAVRPISVMGVDGGAEQVGILRPATAESGTVAYYAKRPAADATYKLFRGTLVFPTDAAPGTLTGERELVVTGAGEPDGSPAVARDGSYMIFTHNSPRKLWSAVASPTGTFVNAANASEEFINFNGDDANPWLAGNPSRALYWARSAQTGGGLAVRRINRAKVIPQSGLVPKFEDLKPVSSPCPDGFSCGGPVVPPDETMMLFWISKVGELQTKIQEIALTPSEPKDNSVAPGTTVIDHPELGERAPAWISDDGCAVIVAGNVSADLGYATRAPK